MTYTDLGVEYFYISNGVTYALNGTNTITTPLGSEQFTFSYLGDQGFGLAPLHRITTRGPLQNGDSDIDYRLDPRVLQIPLMVKNDSSTAPRARHYSIRNALLQIFNPRFSGILRVRISTLSGMTASSQTYEMAVKVLGGLSFDVDPNSFHVRTVVQLRADDPTWYDAEVFGGRVVTYFNANINLQQTVTTPGNWPSFPIIRINGPITNPTVTNNSTGQAIAMTATIAAGAWYQLDLSYGKKTVVDSGGVNRISTVSATSNLATWSLLAGANILAIAGTGTTAATNGVITYYPRYTGI